MHSIGSLGTTNWLSSAKFKNMGSSLTKHASVLRNIKMWKVHMMDGLMFSVNHWTIA